MYGTQMMKIPGCVLKEKIRFFVGEGIPSLIELLEHILSPKYNITQTTHPLRHQLYLFNQFKGNLCPMKIISNFMKLRSWNVEVDTLR